MKIRCRSLAAAVAVTVAAGLGTLVSAGPALAQGAAPGAPGANATWNEANLQGFADSLGSDSKVWYTLGDGELENVFYPETDTPDTFGLQYIVTNGSSFADTETAGTTHATTVQKAAVSKTYFFMSVKPPERVSWAAVVSGARSPP